jgi:hypothetical protein
MLRKGLLYMSFFRVGCILMARATVTAAADAAAAAV